MGIRTLFSRSRGTARLSIAPSRESNDFLHVVASRFEIGVFNEQWLEYRWQLFETLALPSIDAQSARDFIWVLGIDRDMPRRFRERLDGLVAERPYLRLLELELFDDFEPRFQRWCAEASKGFAHVLTTRIDNDDAIHRELLAEVQRTGRGLLAGGSALPAAITAATGYQWVPATGQGFRAYHYSHSIGTSVLESSDALTTVYGKNHRKVPDWAVERNGSVEQIGGDTRWWLYATTATSLVLLRTGKGLREGTVANPGAHEIDEKALRSFGVTDARRLRGLEEPELAGNHLELVQEGKQTDRAIKGVRATMRQARASGEPADPALVAEHRELHARRKELARAWVS
ncbi:putative rhamnosyl transferase [Glycomyces sp. TRM65418]|uniref:glycosyltransferase n=1 Tax=Glycomyces sp. TRM65418 TaxID=2867006 RepID=UPI001CE5CFE8|nr:glycosyltransferase [Glycomyces sp. TRM65418]MCC3762509.1 putative rhamnosyl transferase [Glycomyces sp. TRM65418]QZD56552.1 putative rhamnosyl transferase [Glycomyces sp. TRM65418]